MAIPTAEHRQEIGRGGLSRFHVSRRGREQMLFVATAIIPIIAFFVIFFIYPLASASIGSFTQWRAFADERPFTGLANYRRIFADPIFLRALANTFYYVVISVPLFTILALALALLIEAAGKLRGIFRMIYFLPVVTAGIAAALVWRWLYQPRFGYINNLMTTLGLERQRWLLDGRGLFEVIGANIGIETPAWLAGPSVALTSIIIYSLWKNVGFGMVIYMAGLTGIDRSFYDAAKIDGAGRWQLLRYITLPLLQPTTVFVVVTQIMWGLQVFNSIFIMTAGAGGHAFPGGPANATMVVVLYQYLKAFRELELGLGAAMGVVLFVVILTITVFNLRVLRTRWEY